MFQVVIYISNSYTCYILTRQYLLVGMELRLELARLQLDPNFNYFSISPILSNPAQPTSLTR